MEFLDAVCKSFVDGGLNHPSIIRNNAEYDFIDENLDNIHSVEINGLPAVCQHSAPPHNVDDAMDGITLVRTYRNRNFEYIVYSKISHIYLNFDPTNYKHKF